MSSVVINVMKAVKLYLPLVATVVVKTLASAPLSDAEKEISRYINAISSVLLDALYDLSRKLTPRV